MKTLTFSRSILSVIAYVCIFGTFFFGAQFVDAAITGTVDVVQGQVDPFVGNTPAPTMNVSIDSFSPDGGLPAYDNVTLLVEYAASSYWANSTSGTLQTIEVVSMNPQATQTYPIKNTFALSSLTPGGVYGYRFRADYYNGGNFVASRTFPSTNADVPTFTAPGGASLNNEDTGSVSGEGNNGFPAGTTTTPVRAAILLKPQEAELQINSINPAPTGAVTIQMVGGIEPQNLTLFGGTQVIPADAVYPAKTTFTFNTKLQTNGIYFVRLYIQSGSTNIVYPPANQQALAVSVVDLIQETGQPFQNLDPIVDNSVTAIPPTRTVTEDSGTRTSSGVLGGLVPCGNPDQPQCTFSDVMKLISNLINYIFVLVVPITAIVAMIIGFEFMTSGGKVELRAILKERFGKLVIGLLIVLAAWLIVATVLRTLGVKDAYILLDL